MPACLDLEGYAEERKPYFPLMQTMFCSGHSSGPAQGIELSEAHCTSALLQGTHTHTHTHTLVGRATERESIFPVKMTHHCRSLTSMGVGTVMGLEGRPIFTRPTAVWKHLERLRAYKEARWARK